MSQANSHTIIIRTQDEEEEVNLLDAADVYGELSTCRSQTEDCEIKSVLLGNDGFEGTFGVPAAVEEVVERRRRLGHNVSGKLVDHIHSRRL